MTNAIKQELEEGYSDVYGETFALYDKQEIIEFIQPFIDRFAANNLDAKKTFSGKKCLDAGCGGGRGSIFMLQNGAEHVTAVDYSRLNIKTTKENVAKFGFEDKLEAENLNLANLPFEDETFDVVWCNGVLQHAEDPDAALQEITRVLKTGGQAWIYVYGAGGVYWYSIDRFRDLIKDKISSEMCVTTLRLYNYTTRFVAEYLDDWKVDYLRKYTVADFDQRLKGLGYADVKPLPFGVDYDTNHRINKNPAEAAYLGEGDLRYLITKEKHGAKDGTPVSITAEGSSYTYPAEIADRFAPLFDQLEKLCGNNPLRLIAAAANIQYRLRDLMTVEAHFTFDKYEQHIKDVLNLLTEQAKEL